MTERIVAAAIMQFDRPYSLPAPARHGDVMKHLSSLFPGEEPFCGEQGFITSTGRFVDRKEGKIIAETAEQLLVRAHDHYELYSEDVW